MINTPISATTFSLIFSLVDRFQFYPQGPIRFKVQIDPTQWSVWPGWSIDKMERRTPQRPMGELLISVRAHLALFRYDVGPSLACNQRPSPGSPRYCNAHNSPPFVELEVLDLVNRKWLREIYR